MTCSFFPRGLPWVCLLACATALAGCTKPKSGCTTSSDCPTGKECSAGACVAAPCGGTCQSDQLCENNLCVAADGVNCSHDAGICPTDYTCEADGTCGRKCTVDSDCTTSGYNVCNVNQFVCAQCAVNSDCTSGPYGARGLDVCNANGECVACLQDSDCDMDGMPAGQYCDTSDSTCKQGCLSFADCPQTDLSCTNQGTTPGICVQCMTSDDCVSSPDTPVCDPATSQCVACLTNTDCSATTNQCDTRTNLCVECVENQRCALGQFCDPSTDTCEPGCAGGTGGPNCPTDAPNCNASEGANGTCVACIIGAHDCPGGNICVAQNNGVACVPGCQTDDDCQGAPNGDRYCAPEMGANGTCVQCIMDSQCATHTFCDTTAGICRCHGSGETCTTSADCGFQGVPDGGTPDCNALGASCINVVRCGASDDYTYQITRSSICSQATSSGLPDQCPAQSGGSACPSGYVDEWAGLVSDPSDEGSAAYAQSCIPPAYACSSGTAHPCD